MDTVTELTFTAPYLAEAARPIRPEAGEAPLLPEHIDPACMPRMCPGLARARLALYATARRMDIVGKPTGQQLHDMEVETQTEEYRRAMDRYKVHMAACPECRRMLSGIMEEA